MKEIMLAQLWDEHNPCPFRSLYGEKVFCGVRSHLNNMPCKDLSIEICHGCLIKSNLHMFENCRKKASDKAKKSVKDKVEEAVNDLPTLQEGYTSYDSPSYMFGACSPHPNGAFVVCRIVGNTCGGFANKDCLTCPIGKAYLERYIGGE